MFEPFSTLATGVVFGFIGAMIIFSLILPDAWSTWLATRRNLPFWVGPLSVVGLVAFLVFYFGAWRITILPLATWVWVLLGISLSFIALSIVILLIHRNHK